MKYEKNNTYNKPQFVLQHSGIFENCKKTVVVFLDELLRTDKRRNNVVDMFQPITVLDLMDNSKNFNLNEFFEKLNVLLSLYSPSYNVILCSDDICLLKDLMNNGYGKQEALLTGVTYSINMEQDWKKKQGLFFDNKVFSKEELLKDECYIKKYGSHGNINCVGCEHLSRVGEHPKEQCSDCKRFYDDSIPFPL